MDDWSKFGRSFNSPLCKDYVVRNLTVEEIAKKHESFLGMSCQDVEEWIKECKIPTKEEVYNEYIVNKLSIRQMAEKHHAPYTAVSALIKKYNISKRGKRIPKPTKEELYTDYIVNKFTMNQIRKKYGVSNQAVAEWMEEYDIPLRQGKNKNPLRQ